MNRNECMTVVEAASAVGRSLETLYNWRRVGKGPVWAKDSRGRIVYQRSSVDSWVTNQDNLFTDPPTPTTTGPATPPTKQAPPPFTMPDFLRRQAEQDATKRNEIERNSTILNGMPPTRKAQTPRPQPGEVRPQGVPSSAEWDSHHLAWVWEEDGELLMAGSDGVRI